MPPPPPPPPPPQVAKDVWTKKSARRTTAIERNSCVFMGRIIAEGLRRAASPGRELCGQAQKAQEHGSAKQFSRDRCNKLDAFLRLMKVSAREQPITWCNRTSSTLRLVAQQLVYKRPPAFPCFPDRQPFSSMRSATVRRLTCTERVRFPAPCWYKPRTWR